MDMMLTPDAQASVTLSRPAPQTDEAAVSALDLAFQRATKENDAHAIDRILHPRFWLVLGDGAVVTRADLIEEAKAKAVTYAIQDEDPGTQIVRVWGDTAVVTARLRIKGVRGGTSFDRTLWFSDTYVRTSDGWRYAFAQASLPLPTSTTSTGAAPS